MTRRQSVRLDSKHQLKRAPKRKETTTNHGNNVPSHLQCVCLGCWFRLARTMFVSRPGGTATVNMNAFCVSCRNLLNFMLVVCARQYIVGLPLVSQIFCGNKFDTGRNVPMCRHRVNFGNCRFLQVYKGLYTYRCFWHWQVPNKTWWIAKVSTQHSMHDWVKV